jgi:hypothetical protein
MAGCTEKVQEPPPGPSPPANSPVGIWNGEIRDDRAGAGSLRLTINPFAGIAYPGTWEARFTSPATDVGGTLSIVLTNGRFVAAMSSNPGSVGLNFQIDNGRLTGTYFALGTSIMQGGSVSLAK